MAARDSIMTKAICWDNHDFAEISTKSLSLEIFFVKYSTNTCL